MALGAILACSAACTNFSAESQVINPPILFSVAAEDTGHIISLSAQNTELGFAGYRLFYGATEGEALTTTTNTVDCGALSLLPNQAITYVIEVKPGQSAVTAGNTDNRLCAVPFGLSSGQYVAIRALVFQDLVSLGTSITSNALVVP